MKVLLLKTSSLGDVIHTLPALTDAAQHKSVQFDWVVEEAFSAVPAWHSAVDQVIPVALRRWRRGWVKAWRSGEIQRFSSILCRQRYDLVLDAQGLLPKSAILGLMAHGPRAGYDRHSIRDPFASLTYRHRYAVSRRLHAVERIRRLFSQALDYRMPESAPDYGIGFSGERGDGEVPYLVFLHATTWLTKHWPERYWSQLASMATEAGYRVLWAWYTPEERLRAERMMAGGRSELAPRSNLDGMARLLAGAAGVVGVDSGLAHLAAGLGRPSVTLYGPTSTELTGAVGSGQRNLAADYPCAPCLSRKCREAEPPHRDLGPRVGTGFQPAGCSTAIAGDSERIAAIDDSGAIYPPCFTDLNPQMVWQALNERMGRGEGE